MRITIDPDRCQGHGRCVALLPDLLDADDYGLASPKGDGTVPAGLEPAARLAVANCPEYAVGLAGDSA